jgi:hypothetical protein
VEYTDVGVSEARCSNSDSIADGGEELHQIARSSRLAPDQRTGRPRIRHSRLIG